MAVKRIGANNLERVLTKLRTLLGGYVPASRTVNGKALSANITLTASDVGAAGVVLRTWTT